MFNTASCLLSHASARYYYQSTTVDPAASSFVEYKAAAIVQQCLPGPRLINSFMYAVRHRTIAICHPGRV